jgi:hypothetical protein
MKPGRIAAWAITAIAVPALAACGGSSSGGSSPGGSSSAGGSSAGSGSPAASASAQSQAAGQPSGPGRAGAAGGLTPAGTHLAFGREATVGWVPPSTASGTGAHQGIRLRITVESIKKGTVADFRNVDLNASEQKSTPYYVQVRVTALGNTTPPANSDPAITLNAIDDRGQQQESITFLGTFSRCDDSTPPKPFVSGKSYQSCLAYLIPGGGSIQKVEWDDGPAAADQVTPYFDHPIVWGGN